MSIRSVGFIIVLVFLFLQAGPAGAENWIYYDTNNSGDIFYDKSSLQQVTPDILSVRTKCALNQDAKAKYFSILQSIGKAPESPALLSYYTELLEIDRTRNKIKNVSVSFYGENGGVLYTSPPSAVGQWQDILPASVGEKLLETLARATEVPKEARATPGPKAAKGAPEPIRVTARDGRFIAYDNQTVLDSATSLMWAAQDNGYDISWPDAKRYCREYRGGGYENWRMPTIDELEELYDQNKPQRQECSPKYDIYLTPLINLSCCCPWAVQRGESDAVYFEFDSGRRDWENESTEEKKWHRALPVRNVR